MKMAGKVTSVDTKNFQSTIDSFTTAVKKYRAARERVFDSTELLLLGWEGKGKDTFKIAYDLLKTQLKDEEDNLITISDDLKSCMQSYIDWDDEVGKQLVASKE
jgi:uncharacterized protein YukE